MTVAKNKQTSLISSALVGSAATVPQDVEKKVNAFTLPTEHIELIHDRSTKGDPMLRVNSIYDDSSKGTIQIFARRGHEENFLAYFPEGTYDGAQLQELAYFSYSGVGSNYTWEHNIEAAKAKLELSGQNSRVMEFPEANAKLTREQSQATKNLDTGRFGKLAATTEGGLANVLSGLFK